MSDVKAATTDNLDEKPDDLLAQAGQALFRFGRLFSRYPMREQLIRQTGKLLELSHVLVSEAVASEEEVAGEHGEVTVGAVAEYLAIDPSTASRLVSETIAAGYIARAPSQVDNRRIRLTLTDVGRTLVTHAHDYQRDVFLQMTSEWSDDERREFARQLIRFVAAIADFTFEQKHS